MISKQIGQSAEYNIMYEILRKLNMLTNMAPHIGWNNGGGSVPADAVRYYDDSVVSDGVRYYDNSIVSDYVLYYEI